MTRKTYICGLDTETDHDPDGSNARIVQWALVTMRDRCNENHTKDREWNRNTDSIVKTGWSLDDLMAEIRRLMGIKSAEYVIYVHNLNYDFQFMRGAYAKLIEEQPLKAEPDDIPDPLGIHEMYPFGAFANDHEECFVLAPRGKPAIIRVGNVELRDSSKKLPAGTTVKEMGEMIGMPKLESPRGSFYPGWSHDLTDDDFQYVIRDAEIVARLMKEFHSEGAVHATISSDAMASAKAIFNKHHNKNGYGQFYDFFPKLSYHVDKVIRKGYAGGINLGQHIGMNEGPIVALDVNSMYPTVMMYDRLPYGMPIETTDPEADGFDTWLIRANMKLKLKPGMSAVYKFKFKLDADIEDIKTSDGVVDCKEWHELTMTNVDLENYRRFYDITIDKDSAVYLAFKSDVGLMAPYIEHWFEVKRTAPKNSVRRALAKLMLNSLYGRFGFSPDVTESMFAWSDKLDDIDLKAVNSRLEEVPGYLPYAMFVTANARRRLCDGILTVGCQNVIHSDTDSVKYLGGPELSKTLGHTDALGDWKVEDTPNFMIEGGVKRYVELNSYPIRSFDDVLAFTCAGMPQKLDNGCPVGMWIEVLDNPMLICATGQTFGHTDYKIQSEWLRELYLSHGKNPDRVNTMRLLPKKVPNGVLLVEKTFVMHDMMVSRIR